MDDFHRVKQVFAGYLFVLLGLLSGCSDSGNVASKTSSISTGVTPTVVSAMTGTVRIAYLSHSTGGVIWDGGVPQAVNAYNSARGTAYLITHEFYPVAPYPWENYPYDYWNLWVHSTGTTTVQNQPNLDMLASQYDVIVFKHCFPVGYIDPDTGSPDVTSAVRSLENYYLQYNALKARLRQFPAKRFIVWTGAALTQDATDQAMAQRMRTFVSWVKNSWDEPGDNVYVWDFYALETGGTLYLLPAYATSSIDSHPTAAFATQVAPYFVNRLVDVIEGRGDTGSITGN